MAQVATTERARTAGAPTGAELLASAKELSPFLTEQAPKNEAAGKLTEPVVKALADAGLLGFWIPKQFGGSELSPLEALRIIEQLSYADGSTGWTVMAIQVGTATAAAYLPPSAAQTVFGNGITYIAGQGAPNGKAEAVPGGYRVTGKWMYGSGILHSSWIHTGVVVTENGQPRNVPGTNVPDVRIAIVPIDKAKMLGNWDTLGLRATGSVDYSITDVFVPEEFTHLQPIKVPRQGGNVYRLGIQGLGAICHTGFALGASRRMLDELNNLFNNPTGKPFVLSQGSPDSFNELYATLEARQRAARAYVIESWTDIEPTLNRGQEATPRQITHARLALNYVTSEAADICTAAYKFGGGHALRNTVMQRCYRDMYSGTQHATASPLIRREAGRELLGQAKGQVWGFRGMIDPFTLPDDKRA